MSEATAKRMRQKIRRALGSEAETMLQHVAEGMQQFGLQLNKLREQVDRNRDSTSILELGGQLSRLADRAGELSERLSQESDLRDELARQVDRFVYHRGFLGRFRWLLTGK